MRPPLRKAIDWLRDYSNQYPFSDCAKEARRIADELEAEEQLIEALQEDEAL